MAGRFFGRAAALVVDLRRGDMPVPQQLLHFANIHGRFQEERGRGGPQRVGRVEAVPLASLVRAD